jgi:hypothetical protein
MQKRFLSPKFLDRIDHHLLIHHPETWSTRIHLVIWYSLLFLVALTGICWLVPSDPRTNSNVEYWVGYTCIISVLALVAWLIYLLRFNVFKRFGNTSPIARLKIFILYFFATACIVLFPFIPLTVENIRADIAYADEELVNDINEININANILAYDSLYHEWSRDTFYVVDKIPTPKAANIEAADTVVLEPITPSAFQKIDTADWRRKKENADSTLQINDSLYITLECPDYIFISIYNRTHDLDEGWLSKTDLFYSVIQQIQTYNKIAALQKLKTITAKYYLPGLSNYNSYQTDIDLRNFKAVLKYQYQIDEAENAIENIYRRKAFLRTDNLQWELRVWLYISLVITLLVFIYRHTTTKTFFLSILTGVLLAILTGLFAAFSDFGEAGFFAILIFYLLLFGGIALSITIASTRQAITGIGLNLFVFFSFSFPFLCVGYYFAQLKNNWNPGNNQDIEPYPYHLEQTAFGYAEWIAWILLLLLIPTLIHKLYRKWWALPEN